MKSSVSFVAEPEDEVVCPIDTDDAFLGSSPILYASPRIFLPVHLRQKAQQDIIALSTDALDPQTSLREALDDFTQGWTNVSCVRVLRQKRRMRAYKNHCASQGRVTDGTDQ